MTNILISGYYGFDNAGDDAVLYGIITSLKQIDPEVRIRILSNQPQKTSELFHFPAVNRWSFATIFKEIRKADIVILGGGTLLQDRTSPRSPMYYLGITLLAKMFSKPVFYYGQGFGPIVHSISRKMIRGIVNKVDIITVRDQASGDELRAHGVTKAPIHVTADPALTIDPKEANAALAKDILQSYQINPDANIAYVAIRDWKNEQQFKQELAIACDYLVEKGWQVVFLPMQYPNDISPSIDTIGRMQHKAYLLDTPIDFKQILSLIGMGQLMIGMRLHALILAAIMNVPFVSFSYDPKIDRFVETIGRHSTAPIERLQHEELIKQIDLVTSQLEKEKSELHNSVQSVIKKASEPAQMVLQLVNRHNKKS